MTNFTIKVRKKSLTPHPLSKTTANSLAQAIAKEAKEQEGTVDILELLGDKAGQLRNRGVESFISQARFDQRVLGAIIFYVLSAKELQGALLVAIDTPSNDASIATIAKHNISIEVVNPDQSVSPHKTPKANVPAKAENKKPQGFKWNDGQKTAAAMATGLFASSVPFLLISAWLPAAILLGLCGIVALGTKLSVKASKENHYGVGIINIDKQINLEQREALRAALIQNGFGRGVDCLVDIREERIESNMNVRKVREIISDCVDSANNKTQGLQVRAFVSDNQEFLEFAPSRN